MLYFNIFSLISLFILVFYVLTRKNRQQIHNYFIAFSTTLILWSFLNTIDILFRKVLIEFLGNIYISIRYTPVFFTTVTLLLFSIVFAKNEVRLNRKYYLLFIIPIISVIIISTNQFHNLFYKNTMLDFLENEAMNSGFYVTYIYVPYSYLCILTSIIILTYFTIKNSGFFSKQSILIIIGCLIPFIVNIIDVYLIRLPFKTSDVFFFTTVCFFFAIFKFDFINVAPIATKTIVDNIDYSYVVIDKFFNIIDYNKPFQETFMQILNFKRKENFFKCLEKSIFDKIVFEEKIKEVLKTNNKIAFRYNLKDKNIDINFSIDITVIKLTCIVIMFKDITEELKNEQRMKDLEKFISMGHLIGGIAHNLKGPILSMGGGLDILKKLVKEYDESIGDKNITNEDHHEIAKDMFDRIAGMRPQCSYMSDVISTVKNQMTQSSIEMKKVFLVSDLIKRIDILLNYELKKLKCSLIKEVKVDGETKIEGDITDVIQVINNLLINSAQAYGETGGKIVFKLGKENNNMVVTISDKAGGMKKEIQDKIFDKMITTKGKNGTGLGLYISYTTVTAKLNGKMWFDSSAGKGTTFYISIPMNIKNKADKELVAIV